MTRVALVSCSKEKLGAGTHRARDLYTSQLFRAALAHAEANFEHVFVLSAKHGLLETDEAVTVYDLALESLSVDERAEWTHHVFDWQLSERFDDLEEIELVVFAGEVYVAPLREQLADYGMWELSEPLKGLEIGERLAWFKKHREARKKAAR